MIKFVFLGLLYLVMLFISFELGYCSGYEKGTESCEENVKGESDEEKNN